MPGGGHGERIVVANVDQVMIVFAAAKPEPHVRMLDRFLVIAEGNELDARIVINKIDLVDEAETREKFADYTRAG
jgi:ribosome biogenesis GTPase